MRKRLRPRVLSSGKLLDEIRGVFMTNGRNFSSDLITGLPKIAVPVNSNHTDLFLYRRDGDRMTELAFGEPINNSFPDGVDWTVSRIDANNNKFYITINPNSERAMVNGVIAGAYRVGAWGRSCGGEGEAGARSTVLEWFFTKRRVTSI
jgi:hypothetical protein